MSAVAAAERTGSGGRGAQVSVLASQVALSRWSRKTERKTRTPGGEMFEYKGINYRVSKVN